MTHSIIERDLHDCQNFVYLVANSFFFLKYVFIAVLGLCCCSCCGARAWASRVHELHLAAAHSTVFSVAVAHGLRCPAYGILPDRGSNSYSLYWQADS